MHVHVHVHTCIQHIHITAIDDNHKILLHVNVHNIHLIIPNVHIHVHVHVIHLITIREVQNIHVH